MANMDSLWICCSCLLIGLCHLVFGMLAIESLLFDLFNN